METLALIYLGCALAGSMLALLRPPQLPRYWLLLVIAVVPQIGSLLGIWIPGMFLVTVCTFCIWCLCNRTIPGILIVALGMMLNMLVMAFYGGAMPIHADTLAQLGHVVPHGSVMAGSKDVVIHSPSLALLTDWMVLLSGSRTIIASPGDLIAVVGIVYWLLFGHSTKERVRYDVLSRSPRVA
jgi:Family of unknown function (DUF5317)